MIHSVQTIQFGLTDFCDMACVMCPQTDHLGLYGTTDETGPALHPGARGFMDFDLFRQVLEDCRKSKFRLGIVSLIWLGESLLHPRFLDFYHETIRFGDETRLAEAVVFNTNGQALSPEISASLLDHAARSPHTRLTVTFSLDGWHADTVRKLKPGADPERIRENVQAFLRAFSENRERFRQPCTILLQMIVLEENAAEAEEFQSGWARICDDLELDHETGISAFGECPGTAPVRIVFKRASVKHQEKMTDLHRRVAQRLGLVETDNAELFDLNQQEEADRERFREACSAPFETLVVHWDGRVTPCCADSHLELAIGDLTDESLPAIAAGERARALRDAHLRGNLDDFPRCLPCLGAVRPAADASDFAERARRMGHEAAADDYLRRRE